MGSEKAAKPDLGDQAEVGVDGQTLRCKPMDHCVWVHYGKRKKPLKNKKIEDLKTRERIRRYGRGSERSEDDPIAQGRAKRRKRALADGRDPGSVDWEALDANGEPLISFVPTSKLRKDLKRMLKSIPGRDPARKRIVQKLGAQFARYYTRYRRQAESKSGRGRDPYVMIDSERPAAELCAVNLILKGVTPRELLEHWDQNISNFISDLVIPPLSFLKSPSAIDQVVCRQMGYGPQKRGKPQTDQPRVSKAESRERVRPAGGNTFSDKGALDVGLRAALTEAGFDTSMLNDRYLLSVQYNAVSLARGDEVFLAKKMRGMVEWLAGNRYADSEAG